MRTIFFSTPCFGGQISEMYLHSMLDTTYLLREKNIGYTVFTRRNESLITRARNTCVAYFLANKIYSHCFFIDADIGWNANDVMKLLDADKDVVAGVYCQKGFQWERVKDLPSEGLQERLVNYPVNFFKDRDIEHDGNCVVVKDAPTGFMLIKRQVIEKMVEYYSTTGLIEYEQEGIPHYDLFKSGVEMEEGEPNRYLSEDYMFCRKWQHLDGKVWIDLSIKLDHFGSHLYKGDVSVLFS